MVELIVLPLQCILVSILVCMISLKSGGGGGHQHPVPPCFLPPCTSTIIRNPFAKICREHDCASILDSVAKGTYCFSHGVPTSPFIICTLVSRIFIA